MIVNKDYYHGTKKSNADLILNSGHLYPSRGDRHWLGDGIYFYEEAFYAYNWLIYDYKNIYGSDKYDEKIINKDYSIISANLIYDESRAFNLSDKAEYKILFDITMEEAYNKAKYSKRFKDVNLADGVILNIMFKEMDYNKQFDLIIAIFTRRHSNYGSSTLRLNYIPEKQLCVVNNNIIKNMIEFNFKNNVFSYLKLIDRLDYNYFKSTTSNNTTYYNKRNKKIY